MNGGGSSRGGGSGGPGGSGSGSNDDYWREKYYELLDQVENTNMDDMSDNMDDFNAIFNMEVEKAEIEAFLKDKALNELLAEEQQ